MPIFLTHRVRLRVGKMPKLSEFESRSFIGGYLLYYASEILRLIRKVIPRMSPLVLASQSQIRFQLLSNAGVQVEPLAANIDEEAIKGSLISEAAKARDIADTLAEYKARKIALKRPDRLVLGSDQRCKLRLEFE